ncbi:MAG: PD40 domain-containing protein [Planctomycetales bacterium]|nr:PD40 domain-containing protein [Planctomycetales bacterium]
MSFRERIVVVTTKMLMVWLLGTGALYGQSTLLVGTPVPTPFPINNTYGNIYVDVSADATAMLFNSNRDGFGPIGRSDLWVAGRLSATSDWLEPVELGAPIESTAFEYGLEISPNGLEMFFGRAPAFENRFDTTALWVSRRNAMGDPWGEPEVVTAVDLPGSERWPAISPNGLELYFDVGTADTSQIYVSHRDTLSGEFGPPAHVFQGGAPSLSPNGLIMVFDSNQRGGAGAFDLFVSRRTSLDAPWETPTRLAGAINGSFLDGDAEFSPDGRWLYFDSDRPGVPTGQPYGQWGIWQAPLLYDVGDFNYDERLDGRDIDDLRANFGTPYVAYDLDGSGVVDPGDVDYFLSEIMGTTSGDANLDGTVDDADFDVWLVSAFQSGTGWGSGDFTGDGVTDGLDFHIWLRNRSLSPDAESIPEPSGVLFGLCGVAMALGRRRRQGR